MYRATLQERPVDGTVVVKSGVFRENAVNRSRIVVVPGHGIRC